MTDLDLTRIKKRLARASSGPWTAHPDGLVWAPRIGDPVSGSSEQEDAEFIAAARQDVPALVAELERMQRLLDVPSVDAYESMAAALDDERAAVVEHCNRIAELTALLTEILDHFPPPAQSTSTYARRSEPVPPETLDRWRSRLEGAS